MFTSENNKINVSEISLPKGGGAIKGIGDTFSPNSFTGTGSFSIPFPVTKARGSEPSLSINYSSGSGNGSFGLGFSLSIPKISLKTSLGIPKYEGKDIYLLNGEELVKNTSVLLKNEGNYVVTEYLQRVEGSFSLIKHYITSDKSNSYWEVTTSKNHTSIYGKTQASQIFNPKNPQQIFEWLLCESHDAHGNHSQYVYKAENRENVPDTIETQGHSFNNKYLERIQYGNYPKSLGDKYAFEVIFDYGEYNLENLEKGGQNPYLPANKWKYRPDAFSSFLSGFEIRTCRLCENILLFHHFEEELGNPCLVKRLSLKYTSKYKYQNIFVNGPSTLKNAKLTGYRREGKAATDKYLSRSMPALDLGFSQFLAPQSPEFNELTINGNLPIPDYLNAEGFMPVDLNQEGISGLLYSNNALAYLAPEGNGSYAFPETPHVFPVNHDFKNGENILTDIDGDGTLELVVKKETGSGFYARQKDGKWDNFQPFEQYPTNVNFPVPEMAGLSHNGKSDLLVVEKDTLLLYESKGKKGYHSPERKQKVGDFPIIKKGYAKEFVGFVDVLGDGLPHRVRITNGSAECWPDLGYGNFAEKIVLRNAPVFGDDFDISRLFFADVDGSGTTDLVYAYPDRVELFLNENGNSFSDAITIHLPETYSKIDQISFADILGNGTTCIIFTKMNSTINGKPKHYYYDFVGEVEIDGQQQASLKPYLLNTITNNLGATTQIQYCSSTKFYLEDKKNGTPWITKLPFPVQVIEKVITSDKISGARYTQCFKYHDGFFDSVERTFRGFGYVESWDSEAYNAFDFGIARQNGSTIAKADFVPPVYTRTWHHTGASFEDKSVTTYYKQHFFQGDTKAYDFPDPVFDKDIYQQSPETLRQAYIALKGQIIRTEVYAEDPQEHPDLYQNPFTVTQSNQFVSLRQSISEDNPYAVFLVTLREGINYHYERNPKDPRIEQQFTLETDNYGNVISACQLFLPRRSNPTIHIPKEQQELSGTLSFNQYVEPLQDYLFCHQAYEKQHFQLFGIDLKGAQYFSYENIKQQLSNIDVTTGKNVIPYSGNPTSGVQVQQLSWQQSYFWNNELTEALDLGKISLLGFVHHHQHAVFDKPFSIYVYDGRLINENAYTNQGYLSNILYTKGGYFYDETNGYWWNKGLVQNYLNTDGFYLPSGVENSFADETLQGEHPQEKSLCSKTTLTYDSYYLTTKKQTQYLNDSVSLGTEVLTDYITLKPKQLTDSNQNVHQALFDPLGQVIVTSIFGTEKGKAIGAMSLYASNDTPPEYRLPSNPTFNNVVNSETQKNYLQGASTYFYYNLEAWKTNQQPASAVQLVAFNYWNSPNKDASPYCQTIVEYSDGLGRLAEKKLHTASGNAFVRMSDGALEKNADGTPIQKETDNRWQTSGRKAYNNKGKVYEEYLPYFIDSPLYQGGTQVPGPPPTITIYDALDRPVQVNTPKGFFSKVTFTPWNEQHFDEDDTVLDAPYYQYAQQNPDKIPPSEMKALEMAVKFYKTPKGKVYDNKGHALFEIEKNLGNVGKDIFASIVDGSITSEDVWQALIDAEYLQVDSTHTDLTFLTSKFQPYTKGFQLQLPEKFVPFLKGITNLLKQNQLTAYYQIDIQGSAKTSIDPRLYYGNVNEGKTYYNFKYSYAMDAEKPDFTNSIDAGTEKHLMNIFGQQLWSFSPRDYCQLINYDGLQRKTELLIQKINYNGIVNTYNDFNLVEVFTYGESQPNAPQNNLNGQLYRLKDLSGIVTKSCYSMLGKVQETTRQMVTNYKTPVNWKQNPILQTKKYTTGFEYNALKLGISETTPDTSITSKTYNKAGQLEGINLAFHDGTVQEVISSICYDAKDQRTQVVYGNGVITKYGYEATTLRLLSLKSSNTYTGKSVQDLEYTYDPVGNITNIIDKSIDTVFHANQKVDPVMAYDYDALYRLTKATGRQHIGINANTYKNNSSEGSFMQSIYGPPPSTNDAEKLENYTETYSYDDSGNLILKKHIAKSTSYTRNLAVEANCNRLRGLDYDASGNLRQLDINNPVDLFFNCCENLVKAAIIQRPDEQDDADYYLYDSQEMRTRKVSELMAQNGTVAQIEDKYYLGNYEVVKNYTRSSESTINLNKERQSLKVMDGDRCVLIVQYIKTDTTHPEKEGNTLYRYQLDNHLGSVSLELSEEAQLISYEEYFPYGGTAIITGDNQAEVALKEYRYSSKERDLTTGLYYYGARYYVPWLGRWLKADPAGTVDGMNIYAFIKNNPFKYLDLNGNQAIPPDLYRLMRSADEMTRGLLTNGPGNHTGWPRNNLGDFDMARARAALQARYRDGNGNWTDTSNTMVSVVASGGGMCQDLAACAYEYAISNPQRELDNDNHNYYASRVVSPEGHHSFLVIHRIPAMSFDEEDRGQMFAVDPWMPGFAPSSLLSHPMGHHQFQLINTERIGSRNNFYQLLAQGRAYMEDAETRLRDYRSELQPVNDEGLFSDRGTTSRDSHFLSENDRVRQQQRGFRLLPELMRLAFETTQQSGRWTQ